jgi:hypothetical protein
MQLASHEFSNGAVRYKMSLAERLDVLVRTEAWTREACAMDMKCGDRSGRSLRDALCDQRIRTKCGDSMRGQCASREPAAIECAEDRGSYGDRRTQDVFVVRIRQAWNGVAGDCLGRKAVGKLDSESVAHLDQCGPFDLGSSSEHTCDPLGLDRAGPSDADRHVQGQMPQYVSAERVMPHAGVDQHDGRAIGSARMACSVAS